MKALFLSLISILVFNNTLAAQFEGKVFIDENNNQKLDYFEKGLAGILVSDGLNVVKTSTQGDYSLQGHNDARFVFITTPDGYFINPFYQRVEPGRNTYHFPLSKVADHSEGFSFIHITDTESASNKTNWVEMLQAYAHYEKPAFLIHTGDICYEPGMRFHAQALNTSTMGIPTYYCIGNHDLVEGKYGEELYEALFGPGWYSFEVGGTHFIVTPMLGGDYKPSYTKKDIYLWLKNLLSHLDPGQPKFVFNHDLLTGQEEFIYGINDEAFINLNEHNLKAWVYGHWHNSFYRPHGSSGVVSICTGVAQRGGIDHSLSQFRVFQVQPDGNFTSEVVQSYVDHKMAIISPAPLTNLKDGQLPVLVNAYNSTARTKAVTYRINEQPARHLQQLTNWTWADNYELSEKEKNAGQLKIIVNGMFNDGATRRQQRVFSINPKNNQVDDNAFWPNFLMNPSHDPGQVEGPGAPLALDWVSNVGANIYMCPPVVAEGKVFIASYDNGDARNCFLMAYDYISGEQCWKFRTDNSVKGAIAYENGQLFATDMVGNVYAVNTENGALRWKVNLEMNTLPAYVSGTLAADGVVYTGDSNGFSAINQKDGSFLWKNKDWRGGVGGPPMATIGKEVIVTSSNWNALYAHDKTSGKLLWKKRDVGLNFRDAAPVYHNDTLFVGSRKNLLAIDPQTGDILKRRSTIFNLNTNSTPLIFDNLIIMGTGSDGVVACYRDDFSVAWRHQTGNAQSTSTPYAEPPQRTVEASPVLVNGQDIYIGASDGYFYCLEASSGKVKWSMETGAPILSTVAVTKHRIFLADTAGNLYCFVAQ